MEISVETRRQLYGAVTSGDATQVRKVARDYPEAVREEWPGGGGASYLHLAAAKGQVEVCAALVDSGLDVNGAAPSGHDVPLTKAAGEGHVAVAKWLLAHGAKVDGQATSVVTPLMAAAVDGHVDVATALVDAGAEVNREHLRLPETALDVAESYRFKQNGQDAVIALLRKHGGIRPYTEPHDWGNVHGRAYIEHVERTVGRVSPVPAQGGTAKDPTVVWKGVVAPKAEFRLLFTTGIDPAAKLELACCVPWAWPFNRESESIPRFRWPVGALKTLARAIADGRTLAHGDLLTADDLGVSGDAVSGVDQWIVSRNRNLGAAAKGAQTLVLSAVTAKKPLKPGTAAMGLADKREQAAWKAVALPLPQ